MTQIVIKCSKCKAKLTLAEGKLTGREKYKECCRKYMEQVIRIWTKKEMSENE